jgi:tetratricopeptide (TPR) repeat protein
MIRNDFILRLIEQFTTALLLLFKLRKDDSPDSVIETSEEFLTQYFGLSSDSIISLDDDELLTLLRLRDETGTEEKAVFIAGVLRQEADAFAELDLEQEAYERYLKALHLMMAVIRLDPGFDMPEYAPDFEALRNALSDYLLPPLTYAWLVRYYETLVRYDLAEDVIIDWVDADEDDWESVQAGLGFYKRLGALTPAQLALGGLTPEDLVNGSAELRDLLDD